MSENQVLLPIDVLSTERSELMAHAKRFLFSPPERRWVESVERKPLNV
jgi:hypothetical protein